MVLWELTSTALRLFSFSGAILMNWRTSRWEKKAVDHRWMTLTHGEGSLFSHLPV